MIRKDWKNYPDSLLKKQTTGKHKKEKRKKCQKRKKYTLE
jgi:hypothetical protein